MNILVIGAGATGQVYARHLALGGATVSFLVRPKYKDDHADGFRIYPLHRRDVYEPVTFHPHSILSTFDEVAAQTWDQVWFCVPSTSLDPAWLAQVAEATGDATLVLFAGGVSTLYKLDAALSEDRVVRGMIPMMSYFAPMEGEHVSAPGVAYWFPPFAKTNFGGPPERRDAVIQALRKGGSPAGAHPNVRRAGAVGSAILLTHVVALEGAAWTYDALARRGGLKDSVLAAREGMLAASAELQIAPPFIAKVLSAWFLGAVIRLVRWIAPLDVELFFKTHFSKVGTQVQNEMAGYIALAKQHGVSTAALTRLCEKAFGPTWLDGR